MTTPGVPHLRSRAALIVLISLLIIQGLGVSFRIAWADDLGERLIASSPTEGSNWSNDVRQPADTTPKSAPAILQLTDTETGAMIAAENAALTPPQVLVGLPLVVRP